MTAHVLIVEDEPKLSSLLQDYFVAEGFTTHVIADGSEVVPWLRENETGTVLLDVMLPGKDGMTVLRELREFTSVPVLMVTARVEEIDRLLGLELGADDYICKPFSPREVVARVRAILRRMDAAAEKVTHWMLDEGRYLFKSRIGDVALTAVEFHLLKKLCSDPGRIYSRDQLMDGMYADNRIVSERTIDSHIKKLRRKLEDVAPEFIESVYGVGYRVRE